MQNDNLVSVVIPVYNSEKYLEECLDSILNQSYENIEVIAIAVSYTHLRAHET